MRLRRHWLLRKSTPRPAVAGRARITARRGCPAPRRSLAWLGSAFRRVLPLVLITHRQPRPSAQRIRQARRSPDCLRQRKPTSQSLGGSRLSCSFPPAIGNVDHPRFTSSSRAANYANSFVGPFAGASGIAFRRAPWLQQGQKPGRRGSIRHRGLMQLVPALRGF
jgi:hypothetical protein